MVETRSKSAKAPVEGAKVPGNRRQSMKRAGKVLASAANDSQARKVEASTSKIPNKKNIKAKKDMVITRKGKNVESNAVVKQKVTKATSTPKIKETSKRVHLRSRDKPSDIETPNSRLVLSPIVILKSPVGSPNRRQLRGHKIANYAESSIESSTVSNQVTDHEKNKIPIYKRLFNGEEKDKNQNIEAPKEDLYEFDDCNSDEDVNKKKIIKKRRARKPRAKKPPRDSDKYNKTVENIMQKVLNKVKKKVPKPILKKGITGDGENLVPTVIMEPIKLVNRENSIDKVPLNSTVPLVEQNTDSTPLNVGSPSKAMSPSRDHNGNNNVMVPAGEVSTKDIENCFGFVEKSPKIHVIHNVTLRSPKGVNLSLSNFEKTRPTANSTMIGDALQPWRYDDITVQRHPYYLSLKASALPCLKQDMVLDHTVVDKFDETCCRNESSRRFAESAATPRRSPVQTTVTEFFGSSVNYDISNKENQAERSSFFNEHALSPLKIQKGAATPATPNKRRILVPLLENLALVPENLKILTRDNVLRSKSPDLPRRSSKRNKISFGFNSDNDEEDICDDGKETSKIRKPFRFSMSISDKKYMPKSKVNKEKEVPPPVLEVTEEEDENGTGSETESVPGRCGIFEDLEETTDNLQQTNNLPKKRRKARWERVDDSTEDRAKKKRKEVRTVEEEEEAEKWYQSFNAMCAEVEKFPLEIE